MHKIKCYCTLLLVCFFTQKVIAQTEKAASKLVADSFEIHYNANNFNAIFLSFSAEMQTALPLDKTKAFLTGLKQQVGSIKNKTFTKYETSYAVYKTTCENDIIALQLSVNNAGKINGFFVKPFTETTTPAPAKNTTKLILPFTETWTVVWGGDTKELNYHVESEAQKGAFDMVITGSNGKTYKTTGTTNQDYYAFGKNLLAPCAGEVVLVVDGVKDNVPGTLNPTYIPGNTVIIKTANNEYLFFAHFKQHTIKVKQGQKVQQGQVLGQCGNSGNSSEPHLHFHIQNVEEMTAATGIKCFFNNIIVNGQPKANYSPIQNDKVQNKK
jgi:murein DD-endopeptidase MepM/ murein hydrolase activator NlpD